MALCSPPTRLVSFLPTIASLALGSGLHAQPVVDGSDFDRDFDSPAWTQTIGTAAENNTDATRDLANGSELDALYAHIEAGMLYLGLAGNVETDSAKVDLFFDVVPGGQNRLLGTNASVDGDGLNRMGDDGGGNGLTFDAGFEADYYLTYATKMAGNAEHEVSAATLPTGGGGTGTRVDAEEMDAVLVPLKGLGPNGARIFVDLDNSNTLGVGLLGDPFDGPPDSVATGLEIAIDLHELEWDGESEIRIAGFLNSHAHDAVSNQVIGGLPGGTGNLGEPRAIDFSAIAGSQFLVLLGSQMDDFDGDGVPNASDTNEWIFNPDQTAGSDTTSVGFGQITYLDSDGTPLNDHSRYGEIDVRLPTQIELLWINATVDGVWSVENVAAFPIEIDPIAFPFSKHTARFDFGVAEGTIVSSVSVQLTVSRSPLESFPAGVPSSVFPVSEREILDGTWGDGEKAPLADPDPVPSPLRSRNLFRDPNHVVPDQPFKVRPCFVQADLRSTATAEACAAGAFASSFKWLDKTYGLGLNKTLDEMVADFIDRMGITPTKGADGPEEGEGVEKCKSGVKAKKGFVNTNDLPITVESGTGEKNTIEEIYKQMCLGQDVELWIVDKNGKNKHVVSLVGINKGKKKNGDVVYDVGVKDDPNQRKQTDQDEMRISRSPVGTATDGVTPSLPKLGMFILGWTAESPTTRIVPDREQDKGEEVEEITSGAVTSGFADLATSEQILSGARELVWLNARMLDIFNERGLPPGTPEYAAAEVAGLRTEYLRRAAEDVLDLVGNPSQIDALIEADGHAEALLQQLSDLISLFPPDADLDDVSDALDNCVLANPDQADCNGNGIGDVCELSPETDADGNGFLDFCEAVGVPPVSPNEAGLQLIVRSNPSLEDGEQVVAFTTTHDGRIEVRVFDVTGSRVAHLESGEVGPGAYEAAWDGRDEAGRRVASGVYFVEVRAGAERAIAKLLRVR